MTYGTEMKLLTVWLVVSVLAAVVLMVVLLVRQPPEPTEFWRTTRRYFLLSALICTFLPVLLILGRTAFAVYDWASPVVLDYWWVPLVALAVATLAAAGWLLWRWEHQTTPTSEAPETPEAPPAPAQMWSLPDAQQWDASDRLPR